MLAFGMNFGSPRISVAMRVIRGDARKPLVKRLSTERAASINLIQVFADPH